jgi:hypothetical protein
VRVAPRLGLRRGVGASGTRVVGAHEGVQGVPVAVAVIADPAQLVRLGLGGAPE